MQDSTWKRLMTVFGLCFGGALMWKTVKYFFGATILFWVVAIVIVVKTVCSTVISVMEITNKRVVETMQVRVALENKDKEAERVHVEKMQQTAYQQQKEETKRQTDMDMKRREAYGEVASKVLAYKEIYYKDYNMLQLQEKVLIDWYAKGIGDNTLQNLFNLQARMRRERPSDVVFEQKQENIKREVLISYGLIQDPLMREIATQPKQETPVFVVKSEVANPVQEIFQQPIPQSKSATLAPGQIRPRQMTPALRSRYGIR